MSKIAYNAIHTSKRQRPSLSNKFTQENVAEGGCGVIGVACSIPIKGKSLFQPLVQMHNRGNGKGGGIAAVGLSPKQLGVSRKILDENYLIQVAYLDPASRIQVEQEFIEPYLTLDHVEQVSTLQDYQSIGLDVRPPDVWRYFVRVDESILESFIAKNAMEGTESNQIEDEFIYRNSFALNQKYYASLGEKKAFIVSHGKNMLVLKIVGYAEQVLQYYQLEEMDAHVWVGHQRYPTKGTIWHPGGSHPFIGLHDALVHNGDFANYHSITEYLQQRNMYPLFLTDTEVAVLYWDLLTRVYNYPLEYAIEAIAPTTERDFAILSETKKKIYHAIQATHIHGTPDGPWFFIISRNDPSSRKYQLIGITDTSMLRPQVFALQDGTVQIGLIGSEKQAIDTMLQGLAEEDDRFYSRADQYWYARGGSYTDGGAFIFSIDESKNLTCTDKFGTPISIKKNPSPFKKPTNYKPERVVPEIDRILSTEQNAMNLFHQISNHFSDWTNEDLTNVLQKLQNLAEQGDTEKSIIIETLTLLIDRRYDTGMMKRSKVVSLIEAILYTIFDSVPSIEISLNNKYCLVNWKTRKKLRIPSNPTQTLVIDVQEFKLEGDDGTCQFLNNVYNLGWRKIIAYNFNGHRNFGAGLIARDKIKIDIYGRTGDCLAAFADGPEFYVHESAQDSVAYCFKSGKLVIYGDAGKTFEYGAKGGITFILGDLIDRPLINAVGSTTAVINGSCKDYMGESCMAAHGFSILNGVRFNDAGNLVDQETPFYGGNLFPLAAASSVYLRDPHQTVGSDQLNGGEIVPLTDQDWDRMLPLLKENETLFGITVQDLLTVDGVIKTPHEVYRKVVPLDVAALSRYEGEI